MSIIATVFNLLDLPPSRLETHSFKGTLLMWKGTDSASSPFSCYQSFPAFNDATLTAIEDHGGGMGTPRKGHHLLVSGDGSWWKRAYPTRRDSDQRRHSQWITRSMKEVYGFAATWGTNICIPYSWLLIGFAYSTSQFEARLKTWESRKNLRPEEWKPILERLDRLPKAIWS